MKPLHNIKIRKTKVNIKKEKEKKNKFFPPFSPLTLRTISPKNRL